MSLDGNLGIDLTARDLTGPAFESLKAKLTSVEQQTAKMGDAMGKMVGPVGLVGAGLAAINIDRIVGEMKEFHTATLAQVGSYQTLADRLAVNVELYQAYRLAASSVGVAHDKLEGVLGRFNARLGEAQLGNAKAIEGFNQLGIKILDAGGKMRAPADILTETARALSEVGSSAQAASLSQQMLGESGETLGPLLKVLSTNAGELTDGFKRQGMIVDQETTAALKRLADSSRNADEKIKALYASVAAPIQTAALDAIAQKTADITARLLAANGAWEKFQALFGGNASATMGGLKFDADGSGARLQKIEDLQREIDSLQGRLDRPRRGDAPAAQLTDKQSGLRAQLAALRAEAEAADRAVAVAGSNRAALDRLQNDGLPARDRFRTEGAGNPKAGGKASGGGDTADRIEQQLSLLQGQRNAIDRALGDLQGRVGTPLRELERTVEVQRKIDDIVARAAKTNPSDGRVAQIREAATALEETRYKYQEYLRALNGAEATELKYGDGQRGLTEAQRLHNAELATGRLSYEAYAFAMREASYAAQQQALVLQGQRGGLEGLAAGFQSAANAYQKQNTAYNAGAKVFQDTTSLMSSALTDWRKKGVLDMQGFLSAWVDMLQEMAMRAAAAQVFSAASGALSGVMGGAGGLGGLLGGLFGGGATSVPGIAGGPVAVGGIPTVPFFAEGGRPEVGMPALVGEKGPEIFVPDSAGTVIPNDRLGGGGDIVVQQTINISTGVASTVRAELVGMLPAIRAAAVDAVREARQRGGSFAAAFR